MKCSIEMLSDQQKIQIQHAILPDSKHKLNSSKLATSFNIPVGNTVFRKFSTNDSEEIGAANFQKILDFFNYDIIIVPVKRDSMSKQRIEKIKDESVLNIAFDLEEHKLQFQREIKKEVPKKKDSDKKMFIHQMILGMDDSDEETEEESVERKVDELSRQVTQKEKDQILACQNDFSSFSIQNNQT